MIGRVLGGASSLAANHAHSLPEAYTVGSPFVLRHEAHVRGGGSTVTSMREVVGVEL